MASIAPSESSRSIIPIGKYDHLSDKRREPPKSECVYRIGPAPREDVANAADNSADIGTLDADMDESFQGNKQARSKKKAAGSRALIIYFAKMATKTNKETVDYRFLESLFQGGAMVNVTDKHGQSVMHEISRNWNTDVAKFFIANGADINQADKLGRSPLHLAAAVNHYEMVEYLIDAGANIHARSIGELQTPIHYAAKYNAVGSLKVLMEKKAWYNDRDYKQRTPIFLAAEMAREDTARYLVEYGVPVGVFDDTGMSAIALMVEKMPHIAEEALNQFQVNDSAFRKDYFYLNYLEYPPKKWREENITVDEFGAPIVPDKKAQKKAKREKRYACPTTALKLAVQLQEFDVIMHPVMQQLIKTKWNLYGKIGSVIGASIHLLYIMIWTSLAIVLPGDGNYYGGGNWWRIPIELIGVLMTLIFVARQIWESKITFRDNQSFRMWRTRQLNRDLDYCHPRWPQEKTFLESEMKAVRSRGGGMLSDPWNILDLLTYMSVLVVIVTRLVSVFYGEKLAEEIHRKAYAAAMIFMWLHFMKSCRPFTTLGPFITMLGHVMMDTFTFAFLFFEFFIPYAIGFWILFGGSVNAAKMKAADDDIDPVDWEQLHNLIFATWQVTLNVDFNWDALVAVDRLMAQIMVGTFFAFSTVLCLNLYIALLSETFNRVYANAKANASLLQANTILQIQHALSKKRRKIELDHIQDECGPLVAPQAEDPAGVTDEEMWDKVVRTVLLRFEQLNDYVKEKFNLGGAATRSKVVDHTVMQKKLREVQDTYNVYQGLLGRDKEIYELMCDIHDLKCAALMYLGEGKSLPPKPRYVPPPVLDIRPPSQELIDGANPVIQARKMQKQMDNDLFRSIMDRKAGDNVEDLQDYDDEPERDIMGSWEDINYLESSMNEDPPDSNYPLLDD